jgi:hypothetical protein
MRQSSTKTLAFPLWTEGLATFVSGVLNPESNDDSSLLLDADLGAKCGDAAYVHELAQKYLSIADMSNSIEEAVPVFEDWFLLRGQTLPKRRGYCLGLKVASKIAETHTLAEMTSWNAEESLVEIKKALQQL